MEKLKPITNSPILENIKQLRSFLGCVQYYSRFIKNFTSLAESLYQLVTADSYEWNVKHDKTRLAILNSIQTAVTLASYSFSTPVNLVTDAFKETIGGVLEQDGRPITCISRRLNIAERGYRQTQKEALTQAFAQVSLRSTIQHYL